MVKLYVWYHGTLTVEDRFETFEAAVRTAISISDYGDGSPHGIETADEWITPDDHRWREVERAVWAKQDAALAEQAPVTHLLEVRSPPGEWAQYQEYESLGDAREAAARFVHARIRVIGSGPAKYVWTSMADRERLVEVMAQGMHDSNHCPSDNPLSWLPEAEGALTALEAAVGLTIDELFGDEEGDTE